MMKAINNITHFIKILIGILKTKTKDINPKNHTNPFIGIDLNNYRKEVCKYGLYIRYYDNNNIKRYETYKDTNTNSFRTFNQQGNELTHEYYYKGILNNKTYKIYTYDDDNRLTSINLNSGSKMEFIYNEKGWEEHFTKYNGEKQTTIYNKQGKIIFIKSSDGLISYYTEKGILTQQNEIYFLNEIWIGENGTNNLGRYITKEEAEQLIKELKINSDFGCFGIDPF